ncbi:unnamed protein product [Amoebophrya sp. A25]|nr:unnamed protein product [Amoebophrya sp. A25]|eukprot:GSA25T00012593001.1
MLKLSTTSSLVLLLASAGGTADGIRVRTSTAEMRKARIAVREDMAVIAQNEQLLGEHVESLSSVLEAARDFLSSSDPESDITKRMPADVKEAYLKLKDHSKTGSNSVANVLNSVMSGPAIMVPMLQGMYEKFKGDIKRANAQEKRAADRVQKQEAEYVEFQKEGKTFLLAQKQKVIDYYKRQKEIQHNHYRTLLKMAHNMMGRIKKVKNMCADAAAGKKLSQKELQELNLIAPRTGAGAARENL